MTPEQEAIEGLKLAAGAGVLILVLTSLLVLW
ncbi:hypothetical protein MDG893_11441 [Marinobacter algicola DG893]|uniref:Uncharacterized protein n=1 Tax=Marinobacter algicola DG893 TaxID=443152 RepID=A6EVG3_9GAMM|nr:hypothetical protein MDG893_11441 [Marinobacter algicola DG893]